MYFENVHCSEILCYKVSVICTMYNIWHWATFMSSINLLTSILYEHLVTYQACMPLSQLIHSLLLCLSFSLTHTHSGHVTKLFHAQLPAGSHNSSAVITHLHTHRRPVVLTRLILNYTLQKPHTWTVCLHKAVTTCRNKCVCVCEKERQIIKLDLKVASQAIAFLTRQETGTMIIKRIFYLVMKTLSSFTHSHAFQ